MSNIRRAPRYHHYWIWLSHLTKPTKHTTRKSPLIDAIVQRFGCDRETARLAFESAKQAKYIELREGKWVGSPERGLDHWNKKPTGASPAAPPPAPDGDGLDILREKAKAYANAKAHALTDCRQWPRMSKLDAMERAAQEWPELDSAQHAQLFKQLAQAGSIVTGPDWIRGNPA